MATGALPLDTAGILLVIARANVYADRLGRWDFGTSFITTNGAKANVRIGSNDYLLRRFWVPGKNGNCSMAAP